MPADMQGAASQVLPNRCMTAGAPAPCLTCPPPGTNPKQDPGSVCQWAWLGKPADLDACQALATAVDGLPGRSDAVCQTATWCHAEAGGAYDKACYCGLGVTWTAVPQTSTDATICLRFGTPWGVQFLVIFFPALAVYVGAGVGYSVRTTGAPARIESHPHWGRWREVQSLCADGAAFARSRGHSRAERGQRRPLMCADDHDRAAKGGTKALQLRQGKESSHIML